MAIVTRQEFAELCGKTVAIINTNISRKKIEPTEHDKGLIDTAKYINKKFIQEQVQGRKEKNKVEKVNREKEKIINKTEDIIDRLEQLKGDLPPAPPTRKDIVSKRKKEEEDDNESSNLDLRKKKADTLKAEKQAELERLKVEKMMGQLMPTDMVEAILKGNIGHIYKTMESELMNIASIYCDVMANGDRSKLAEVVKRMRDNLERIVNDTRETALVEMDNVINEYSEARNRGERK